MTLWSGPSGNPAHRHSEGAGNPPSLLDIPLRNILKFIFLQSHPDHPDFNVFFSNLLGLLLETLSVLGGNTIKGRCGGGRTCAEPSSPLPGFYSWGRRC